MQKAAIYETKAREFLRLCGYTILANNVHSRFGEIDVIGKDNGVVAFIEVKMRRSGSLVLPREAVTRHKRDKIRKTALWYVQTKTGDVSYRFDVVEIIQGKGWRQFELIKNAFAINEEL